MSPFLAFHASGFRQQTRGARRGLMYIFAGNEKGRGERGNPEFVGHITSSFVRSVGRSSPLPPLLPPPPQSSSGPAPTQWCITFSDRLRDSRFLAASGHRRSSQPPRDRNAPRSIPERDARKRRRKIALRSAARARPRDGRARGEQATCSKSIFPL